MRACHRDWLGARTALAEARGAVEAAAREEDWLRQSVQDLSGLNPQPDEEAELAGTRQALQQGERRAEAIAAALAELSPRDRRNGGPAAALRAAGRALQRLLPTGSDPHPGDAEALPGDGPQARAQAALEALDHAEAALAEAEGLLSRLAADQDGDPRLLEQTEERLFALRAGARKHGVAVIELPGLLAGLRARLESLEGGQSRIAVLERAVALRPCGLRGRGAPALGAARAAAARRLELAVTAELRPLRLERARFTVSLEPLGPAAWTARGMDAGLVPDRRQPGPAAGAAGPGRVGRRAVPADAGAEGGAGRPLADPDPGVRRGR